MKSNEKFNFFLPVELIKGTSQNGGSKMVVKGIASTGDQDADDEFLDPKGFDLQYFLKSGFLNWDHQAKNNPSTIVGFPTKAEITKSGKMYLEGELFEKSAKAKEVWELAEAMNGTGRMLGFSIEGKVVERDPVNPKVIKKAKITGCAITPNPKNTHTLMEIVKGHYEGEDLPYATADSDSEEFLLDVTKPNGDRLTVSKSFEINIEKAESNPLSEFYKPYTDTIKAAMAEGSVTTKESVDGDLKDQEGVEEKKSKNIGNNLHKSTERPIFEGKLTKSMVYEHIFTNVTEDLQKADMFYDLLKAIELKHSGSMATEKPEITEETIQKAMALVGLGESSTEEIIKSEAAPAAAAPAEAPKTELQLEIEKAEQTLADLKAKEAGEEIAKSENAPAVAATEDNEIMKSIGAMAEKFDAFGTIMKGVVMKELGELKSELASIKQTQEDIASTPQGRKSILTKSFAEKQSGEQPAARANDGMREVNINDAGQRADLVKSIHSTINASNFDENANLMRDISNFEVAPQMLTQNILNAAQKMNIRVVTQ